MQLKVMILIRLYFFFYMLLASVFASATQPKWFYQLNLKENEIVGFGVSDTFEKARVFALKEISETLQVKIKSEYTSIESIDNSIVTSNSISSIDAVSNANLFGVTVFRSEEIDGQWYVGMLYDNSSLAVKIKKVMSTNSTEYSNVQNVVYSRSRLINNLNSELDKALDYRLVRKNKLWCLNVENNSFPLNERQVTQLFHSYDSPELKLVVNKKHFIPGEYLNFKVLMEKPGYVSIVYAESSGKVGVILDNKQAKKSFSFPDGNIEFIISNLGHVTLTEMYVVLWSEKRVDLDQLNNVSASYLDESSYGLDLLLSMLTNISYSSVIIKIAD